MKYWLLDKIFNKSSAPRQIEYLAMAQDLKILDISDGVERFADFGQQILPASDVRDSFPELVGVEDMLIAILQGEQDCFEYKGIARFNQDNSPVYINLYIIADEEEKSRLLMFVEDVTEKMVLEQTLVQRVNESHLLSSALIASKNYIGQIISSMADALLVTNNLGQIKTVNKAAQDLFGYSETELINQSIAKIMVDGNFVFQILEQYSLSPGELLKDVEVICATKNGKKVFVSFSCSSIQTEIDNVQDFIYIARDITERQRLEKRLLAQYVTTRILSDSITVEKAIPKILLAICESLGWNLGEFWIPEKRSENAQEEAQPRLGYGYGEMVELSSPLPNAPNFAVPYLRCVEIWSRPSPDLSNLINRNKKTLNGTGAGFAGRIWATASPQWITDVFEDPNFLPSDLALLAGLHTAFGFPIQSNNEVLGVMTFYSCERQQIDEDLLQMMATVGSQIGQFIKRKRAEEALRQQQQQTEILLLNILPEPIVNRLKQQSTTIAESFSDVTVMFADIVGFTELSSRVSPTELVEILNVIFSGFDNLAEIHGLEKIKTIGDAYMVVGGLPVPQSNHAIAIAEMALDMQTAIAQFSKETGQIFKMRIGINTGPVVAGVIGTKKFIYDLWGNTVNIASRMESHGLPGEIQVTESTYKHLCDRYLFEERGEIEVKGKGKMLTYWLTGRLVVESSC